MELDHETWVVVANGAKYLVLRNQGDRAFLDLRVLRAEEEEHSSARDLSSDKPGRRADPSSHYSAMEETDWHEVGETRFADKLTEILNKAAQEGRFDSVVITADAKILGEMRKQFGKELQARILAEVPRDMTNLPVAKIEEIIRGMELD